MKVLVAIDLSSAAELMLSSLVKRRWPRGCQFHVLTVIENTTGSFGMGGEYMDDSNIEACRRLAEDRLLTFANGIRRHIPAAAVSTELAVGGPAELIVERAKDLDVNLIVLGHQGTYAQGGYSLGGVAERVVQRASCAVNVLKPAIDIRPLPAETYR